MWINHQAKTVFMHVPRTSGISLQTALKQSMPSSLVLGPVHEHLSIHLINALIPSYTTFTIMRNPFQIFRSMYWVSHNVASKPKPHYLAQETYDNFNFISSITFEQFIEGQLEKPTLIGYGGFSSRYINSKTLVYRYEDEQKYNRIAKMLGCSALNMPHMNQSYANRKFKWTTKAIKLVEEACHLDLEMFGYQFTNE